MHANEEIATPTEELTSAEAPAQPKAKKGKKSKRETGQTMTLAELAKRYIDSLAEAGKSEGTQFSYRIELRTAIRHFGEEKLISTIDPYEVLTFFEDPKVTRLKTGRIKAKPSIDKTRRVLRLALCYAVEQKWLDTAPLPEPPPESK